MDSVELRAELEKLKAENELLKKKNSTGGGLKVSAKGGVSIYGINRLPITLYSEQWKKLIAKGQDILDFIEKNASLMSHK